MKRRLTQILCGALSFCVAAQPAQAALMTLATQPLFLGASIPPQVMITMTKDQQLYKKAYNDYSDLDNDGVLETTYKHAINYYGYFDSTKCYDYSTANRRFEPFGTTSDKYCTGANAGKWSGNFLNWVAMTRMDAVRKLLYGGLRSTDTATTTVLERTFLPTDAHAYAKYYSGSDVDRLTPFTVNTTPPVTTSGSTIAHGTGSGRVFSTTPTTGYQIGHQVRLTATAGTAGVMIGNITAISAGASITVNVDSSTSTTGNGTAWNIENMSKVGISFCNVTLGGQTAPLGTGQPVGSSTEARSQTNPNPPIMRVVDGNYALWAANERFQCYFQSETTNPARITTLGGTRSNGNRSGLSGLFAAAFEPVTADGLGAIDYVVRVQACVAGLLGAERCKEYNTVGSFKPIGLLQLYGDPGLIHFGLLTGSYSKNISGGVLRKNVGTFTDEVAANGTFLTPAGGGIVNSLNRMRIIGYHYHQGLYNNAYPDGDSCAFQLTNITEGNCRSWGNPMSEIYFEALRYFSGQTTATAAFATSNDSTLLTGLTTATWPSTSTQVLSNSNFCAPLNVLVFNSSVSTNEDTGQIGALSVINSGQTVQQLTTAVGNAEPGADAVSGTNRFFYGKDPALAGTDPGFELCSAKNAPGGGLGDVIGICPEGPTLGGTYHMAGLAHHAKINRIRTDITAVPASDTKSLKVTTYGINLSTNVPTLPIKVAGDVNPRAIIQPIYRLFNAPPFGGGALVDLKIVSQAVTATSSSGTIYLNWEDSEQGGDYDQDMWGLISWCMQVNGDTTSCPQNGGVTDTLSVTTDAIAESTGNPQGFGYVVSGTTQDGPHFHSGIENFNFTETQVINIFNAAGTQINGTGNITANGGCVSCDLGDGPTTARYTLSTTGIARNLKDPLFYAAKYGGFTDSNGNNLPDLQSEWDVLLGDGSVGTDGNPDNYFLVSNPLGLETALNKVFLTILQTASASSVATNSTSLNTGTKIYQARFNANDWSGQLLQFQVNADGTVSTTADWDAGVLMNPTLTPSFNHATQQLVTFNKGISGNAPRGIPLRWPANPSSPGTNELTPAMVTALKTNPATGTVESDAVGLNRLNFLRGDGSNEGTAVGQFRRRQTSKLGDIINSNPTFVGPPSAGHGDAAYAAFRLTHASRTPVIYAAGGDGFLHGFDASATANAGTRIFGYMPSKALLKANKLTNPAYQHEYYVDGTPEVQDVCTSYTSGVCTNWRTMLAVAMGAGGQSVSLLDITDPTGLTEANAANVVKWEFTDEDHSDLGFSYGQPLLRRMANDKWAVIVAAGYNNSLGDGFPSTNGRPVIYVIFVSGPSGANGTWVFDTDFIRLRAASGTGSTGTPAGFAPPFAADIDADGKVDFIYAGNNEGGFWKFDVRSTNPVNWRSTSNRVLLFRAVDGLGNPQPITSAAEGTGHITGQGFMINFGTGKFIEPNDVNPPGPAYTTQTYYGIWDKNDATPISGQTTVTRSQLFEQQVLADVVVSGKLAHVTSNGIPDYTNAPPVGHLGWFLDWTSNAPDTTTGDKLPPNGERAVFTPQIINGRLVFTTLIPNVAACLFGGDSVTMVLDNQTGSRFDTSPFDISGDGQFNTGDLVNVPGVGTVAVSGISSGIGITGSPTVIKFGGASGGGATPGAYLGGYVGGAGSGAALYNTWLAILSGSSASTASILLDLGANSIGRLNWREITAD
jgi:type IV pilus assembly protein PilY1